MAEEELSVTVESPETDTDAPSVAEREDESPAPPSIEGAESERKDAPQPSGEPSVEARRDDSDH